MKILVVAYFLIAIVALISGVQAFVMATVNKKKEKLRRRNIIMGIILLIVCFACIMLGMITAVGA